MNLKGTLPRIDPARMKEIKEEFKFNNQILKAFFLGIVKKPLPPLLEGNKRPVVFVPGWVCRPHVFEALQNAVNKAGHPVYTLPLGFQVGNILDKSKRLSAFLSAHNLNDVYVMGHSMGGLISLGALVFGENRIRKVWTMGSPLWGTQSIYFIYGLFTSLAVLGGMAGHEFMMLFLFVYAIPSLRQMLPGSDLLRLFHARLDDLPNVRCIYAAIDEIVIKSIAKPESPSRLGREDDVMLDQFGHNNLFMGEGGIRLILDQLSEAEKVAAAG